MLETPKSYLVKKQNYITMQKCKRIAQRKFCCSSKTVIWILVLYGILQLSTTLMNYGTALLLTSDTQLTVFKCVLSGIYVFFPILAYSGERFNRYRIMMSGVVVTILSYFLYILLLIVQAATIGDYKESYNYAYIPIVIPAVCSTALYIANIPQFGATQLQFASSEHLAAFARWTTWTYLFSNLIADVTVSILMKYNYHLGITIVNGMCFLILLLGCTIFYRLRHTLIIDPPPQIDGLKLIWQVMKYSWKHKYPVKQSAFTYSEDPPSRLDLAKERYGGPFTTKQVEEVKSFWYMLLIPICHFFNTGYFSSGVLTYQYKNCQEIRETSIFENILLANSTTLNEAVAVIGLVLCQLIIVAFCPKFIPSILQRIWIGLFFLLLSSLSVMVISFNVTGNLPPVELSGSSSFNTCDELWPYYVFIVPELLTGLGQIFNLSSQMEFILAQAPHNMQSIFIGAFYIQYFFPYLCNTVGIATTAGRYWQYYTALSFLQLIVFVAFTIIKRHYKYRQCNNDSDINIRMNIEDVYERDLNARDLAKRSYQSISVSTHDIPFGDSKELAHH